MKGTKKGCDHLGGKGAEKTGFNLQFLKPVDTSSLQNLDLQNSRLKTWKTPIL